MLTLDEFKQLETERKRLMIEKIVLSLISYDDEDGKGYLEKFIFGATDEDLVEFYEILLNPEKTDSYINKKGEEIRKGNIDVKNLNAQLNKAKVEMLEDINQENSDELLRQI